MAGASVGLSTHIWNNNIRCVLLLMFYPVLILAVFWAIAFALSGAASNGVNNSSASMSVMVDFANNIVFDSFPIILTGVSIWFMIAWFFNSSMIRKLSHSQPVTRSEEPELYNLLENLCISQGMKMPRLEIIETHARNAFASGMSEGNFAVTITRGLMNSLSKDELEGVIAHELTHIQNRDVRLLIVCIIFTGLFGFLSQLAWSSIRYSLFYGAGRRRSNNNNGSTFVIIIIIAVILFLGYLATLLMRFALSRRREYMADAGAISMTKNPDAMMRALMRISGRDRIPEATDDIAMMCIENNKAFLGMFATHPPIDKRIKAISEVTNTPIPDKSNLVPVNKKESFSHKTRDKATRTNPWLIRQRRD